jgi:signal transduction histidine kinase
MLTLARLDSAHQKTFKKFDVTKMVRHIERQMADEVAKKNLTIEYRVNSEPTFYTEPVSLEILLRNILENAVNYSRRDGHIVVDVSHGHTEIMITVSDSGPGIEPGERERVFERYYRKPGQQQTGSGLGLSIARRCAELLGADIELQSADNNIGLKVIVRLRPMSE